MYTQIKKCLSNHFKWGIIILPISLLLLVLTSRSDNGTSTSTESPQNVEEVSSYLQDLPSWNEFSPPKASQRPTAVGEVQAEEEVVPDVDKIDVDGNIYTEENVTCSCQSQPFTLTDNPRQIAMYSLDREILYAAGGLIQGKNHRDRIGSLSGLPIAEWAPLDVRTPGLRFTLL